MSSAPSWTRCREKQKAESRKQKAESRKQKAESRKQKAESRKRKAESRRQKAESGKRKAEKRKWKRKEVKQMEMREGRLSDEFRARTKKFAAFIIRILCAVAQKRDEVQVCARQMLRSGTSVRPTLGKLRGLVPRPSSSRSLVERSRKRMRLNCGLNFYEKNAALIAPSRHRLNKKPTS